MVKTSKKMGGRKMPMMTKAEMEKMMSSMMKRMISKMGMSSKKTSAKGKRKK